jgi:hypothetical protein
MSAPTAIQRCSFGGGKFCLLIPDLDGMCPRHSWLIANMGKVNAEIVEIGIVCAICATRVFEEAALDSCVECFTHRVCQECRSSRACCIRAVEQEEERILEEEELIAKDQRRLRALRDSILKRSMA